VHLTRAFLSSKNRLVRDRSFGDRLFVGNGIIVVFDKQLLRRYCGGKNNQEISEILAKVI
jgi:hypothetical protein